MVYPVLTRSGPILKKQIGYYESSFRSQSVARCCGVMDAGATECRGMAGELLRI